MNSVYWRGKQAAYTAACS